MAAIDSQTQARSVLIRYAFDRLEHQCTARRVPDSPVFEASPQQFSDEIVLTLRPEVGTGHSRLVRLAPGVMLVMSRFQLVRPITVAGQQDGQVTFTLNLDGGYRAHLGNRTLCVSGPSAIVMSYPSSFQSNGEYVPGVKQEIVSLVFSSTEALRAFGLSRDALPLLPTESGRDGAANPSVRVAAAEAPAIEACAALQHAPYEGQLRNMYLQAKARELICHILAAPVIADSTRRQQSAGTNALSIAAAVESQLSRSDRQVSVEEIAEEVGVSSNHLRRMYRSVHGCTIRDAALKARMARARRLLTETRLPIIEIALALGYEHHASFSTAYRKEFGETPMRTRRRGAVATPAP
ncbi:helix-turn-helix domain-containing protein [Steroidobacter sp.]|uniref:helix-turn-helix domain-containing protein n=1 Tax=Steroidobacter sp. TaxID=1978227 RepID=UPI001A63105E|nr:AraC family transcriptional regulator [Steroidobacter sp.]MBL8269639.1 helix-turn-helix transcriptional regulator [Steroidobacter sp.]